jgi:hypothetical protein
MPYLLRITFALLLNRQFPNYAGCQRCLRVWPLCRAHNTIYREEENGEQEGCTALCEECWREIAPYMRLYYYQRLVEEWKRQSIIHSFFGYGNEKLEETWYQIRAAVMAGK